VLKTLLESSARKRPNFFTTGASAARTAVLLARFKPARVGERVVQQLVEQPFAFRIRP
jgi:hypothetical protein